MNAVWLLMGLLVLSYLGSSLVSGRVLRGIGLPSGAEYVVLGFVLGPSALGLLEPSSLAAFEPVAGVALGWLALVVGLDFGFVGSRRVRPSRMALCVLMSLLTGGAVAAAVWFAAAHGAPSLDRGDRALLAAGVGAVSAETTRHAVLWVTQRYSASGKLSDLIADIADCDDLGPLLMMGGAFALVPQATAQWPIPFWGWTVVTALIGVVLGLIAVVLLGSDFRLIQSWGVLLGASLLTMGTSARVGLSPLFAAFAMGVTIAALSRHRDEIVAMVAPTERPVILPSLLLAGAHVNPKAAPFLPWIVAIALGARLVGKLATGLVFRVVSPDARETSPWLGLGLLSSGAVAMSVGLAFALRFPGPVGHTVLFAATAAAVFGELVGPQALRATLRKAGELAAPERESLYFGRGLARAGRGAAPGDGGERGGPPSPAAQRGGGVRNEEVSP
ncbi:cation:proton antiporter [Sorangium sp. So ce295]|uniref:cation:proton antiporter n=1 Tax=Sorangium sp. So ce295 TaxID=3133295 RepID=UPI003F5F0681